MSLELSAVGLIVAPLGAGILAFAAPRLATALSVAVALLLPLLAGALALGVWENGSLVHAIGGWGAPLGIDLYVDGLAAVMIGMSAVVTLAVMIYAAAYLPLAADERSRHLFWPLVLLLSAAMNALFLSGDVFNLYITLELLTLAAVALVGLEGTVEALAEAVRYLLIAIVGSLFYLLGVALLYGVYGTVDWQLLAARFELDWPSRCAVVLMAVGLLVKTALFPLHAWLPGAHANAPSPASALLSGLVLKASFFVLLRLWYDVFHAEALAAPGQVLAALGAVAILWGSAQAIRQPRLKMMVAYSTVAQIGYLFLVFALTGVAEASWDAWAGTIVFAVSHATAKAAAFMAAGSLKLSLGDDHIDALAGSAERAPFAVFAFGLAGLGLIGLPPSGGFLAKWMLLGAALEAGRWDLAVVILVGGLLAAIYVGRVVARAFVVPEHPVVTRPRGRILLRWTPLVLAMVSVLFGLVARWPLDLLAVGAPFVPMVSEGLP